MKLNWKKLKDNKCPKCVDFLTQDEITGELSCQSCEFRISGLRFKEIVDKLYFKPRFKTEEDNLSELNNL